jgi:uncharacterized protein (TIGR00251 family)
MLGPFLCAIRMLELTRTPEGIIVPLKVVPGASRDRIAGALGGTLKITIAAPPEKGKANRAVVRLLADALGVRPNQIEVVRGLASPNKSVLIRDTNEETIRSLLVAR